MRLLNSFSLALLGALALPAQPAADPVAIMRRSLEADNRNEAARRNYTFDVLEVDHEFDSSGKVKTSHSTLREVMFLTDRSQPFRRLVERDGKPLTPIEETKEKARLDTATREAAKLTPAERKKRADAAAARAVKEREDLAKIPDAFDFKLLGEPVLNGRPSWEIRATPKGRYKGKASFLLRNVEGTLWIDKQDYAWAKIEMDALNDIAWGWFVARIAKGTHILVERFRVNDEIWATKHIASSGSARLLLVKKYSGDQDLTYSNYRKFQTDSRVVNFEEK